MSAKADLRYVSKPASDAAGQAASPAKYPRQLYPEIECHDSGMLSVGDGHSLYYDVSGNPNGVPCIFLHGGPGGGISPRSRRFFDPAFFRIVIFDQRGSGKSPAQRRRGFTRESDREQYSQARRGHREVAGAFEMDKWGLVLGGSWGSTLGLAYAEAHPAKVRTLLLRGVFLFEPVRLRRPSSSTRERRDVVNAAPRESPTRRSSMACGAFTPPPRRQRRRGSATHWSTPAQEEVDYLFAKGGTQGQHPAAWAAYCSYIRDTSDDFESERQNLLGAYWKRLTSDDAATRLAAASAFVGYELSISKTFVEDKIIRECLETPSQLVPFAVMEVSYMLNAGFMSRGQLIAEVGKLSSLERVCISHGRSDFVCQPVSAYRLSEALGKLNVPVDLDFVAAAGHSDTEPGSCRR